MSDGPFRKRRGYDWGLHAWLNEHGLAGSGLAARLREAGMSAVDELHTDGTEAEKVEAWRARRLLDAGYPAEAALELAHRPDVDLALAERLLTDGCPLQVALDILR